LPPLFSPLSAQTTEHWIKTFPLNVLQDSGSFTFYVNEETSDQEQLFPGEPTGSFWSQICR